MKFKFVNDTGRLVTIHPGTKNSGVMYFEHDIIQPLEVRTFLLPEGTYPYVKLWDNEYYGLSILVSPQRE